MVDELNDETEAHMDALEDRTRALAARVEALTAERDAYKKAKAENGARFQRERDDARTERDAAVKAKEEAERDLTLAIESKLANARLTRLLVENSDSEVASLRAQVEQLTVERGEYAVKADGSYREVQRLVHQVEQMRGREMALRKLLWLRHGCEITSLYGDDGEMQCPKCGDFRRDEPNAFDERWQAAGLAAIRAALSPSPASSETARTALATLEGRNSRDAVWVPVSPCPASTDDCEHDTEPTEGGLVCKRCKMVFLPCPGCNDAEAHGIVYHAPPLCPVGAPSSVSALFPGVPLVPHEGSVTYEPKTTLPEPASGVAEAQWGERRSYVTDDRDEERRNVLTIAPGENGDWYVSVHPESEGDCGRAVRLCTSGGAASNVPGLTVAIANAYRALAPSPASPAVTGEVLPPETYPQWKAGGWGPDTVDGEVARKALPEPASGVAEVPDACTCAQVVTYEGHVMHRIGCPVLTAPGKDGGR